jgi:hypothetical protein
MNPAAVDHSATRCRERRLFTNARIEWMAAIKYAATAASSKERIEEVHSKPGHKEAQKKQQIATKAQTDLPVKEKHFVLYVSFCGSLPVLC